MKKTVLLFMLVPLLNFAQTMYVEGKDLYTAGGQKITLRGINYPIIDEGWNTLDDPADYKFKIEEAAKTGANAIRIPWYTNGTHWMDAITPGTVDGFVTDGTLSEIIRYSHEQGMIPILELHDPNLYINNVLVEERITCSNNWDYFNTVVRNWWKSQVVLDLIEENKEYLIINLANEFGKARWIGNVPQQMNIFETNYSTLIHEIRQLGVEVPIMIDATDCGTSSTELLSISASMQDTDPLHKLVFSAHSYWFEYANTADQVETKLTEIQNSNVPFLLGEVANRQNDDQGNCSITLDYASILLKSCQKNIGWLGWAYTQDQCSARKMTTNGVFNTLTAYGQDLVYNSTYGLISGECAAAPLSTKDEDLDQNFKYKVYPNPAENEIGLDKIDEIKEVKILDISGKLIQNLKNDFHKINISFLTSGIYTLEIKNHQGKKNSVKFIKK